MSTTCYYRWADLPQTEMTPKIKRRLVSGEKVMVVELTFAKGAVVSEHTHPHEQMTHIVSGRLEFDVQGRKQVAGSGEIVYVPSGVPHAAVALEDTVTLDIFSPPREDFLTGNQAGYMK